MDDGSSALHCLGPLRLATLPRIGDHQTTAELVRSIRATAPFGEMPAHAFMGLAITDTFQHAWDLAEATGRRTWCEPGLKRVSGFVKGAGRSVD